MHNSPTPHNNFFYQVMSRKKKATAFLKQYLPKNVLPHINLDTLSLAESKHLSDSGTSLYNDVLYRYKLTQGNKAHSFVMCEHQSTPDPKMPLRLLKYNIATIEGHFKQDYRKFPVIVNIVLYHGSKPWNYSTTFSDYYVNIELGKEFLYMAPFTLVDVSKIPQYHIHQDRELGFFFEAFRCTGQPDPYMSLKSTIHRFTQFRTHFYALPKETRNLVGCYLSHYIDLSKYSLADLVNLVSSNLQEKKEFMTTIAQAIKQEGRQEGRREGRQEGILEIAKNMLSKLHLDVQAVKEATGLSIEELMKLQHEVQN